MSLLVELKRRNVFRVAAAYVVFSWLTLQIGDVVFPALHLPDWTLTLITVLLAIGFLPAMIISWVYELTPEGVKKESEIDRANSVTAHTGRKLDVITLVALVGVVAFVLVERGSRIPQSQNAESAVAEHSGKSSPVPTAALEPQTGEAQTATTLSIAVLPFVNMSADADNEYFSDGVSEELLNVLARIPELKVAARTSAFQFKGQNLDVAEIGRILKVSNILEGSVRKSGNRVRVTAQLIKVDDGFHLWSDTYDRELTDIFAIQDEIAGAIAEALKTTLDLSASKSRNLTGTISLEAYELYLRGIQNWHLREAESLRKSERMFLAAIDIDPEFAKAHAGLALTNTVIASYVMEPEAPFLARAISAAKRALAIEPRSFEALAAMGNATKDPLESARLYDQAIAINPSFATAYQWYGLDKATLNELDEGTSLLRRAFELDPRSRIIANNLATILIAAGDYEGALAILHEAESFAPDYGENLEFELMVYLFLEDFEVARTVAERLARVLDKRTLEIEPYLALFGPSEGRTQAADTLLSWPGNSRLDSESPALLYDFDLLWLLARAGMEEHALSMISGVAATSGTVLGFTRSDVRLKAFNCRADVFKAYLDGGLPPIDKQKLCADLGEAP